MAILTGVKIGIDTEGLSGTIRGIGYYTLTLIEALKRVSSSSEEVTLFHSPNKADTLFPDLSHHHFRKKLPIPLSNSLAALCHRRCFDHLDLLHFPEPKILYGRKPRVPFVLTIHDVMPLLFPHLFPKKSYLMMRHFLSRYLKEAAAVVAVSHQTSHDLTALFPFCENKVTVIPCSLLPKERVIEQKKEPLLFYIGSFEPRKNLEGIIKAFGIIKERGYPHRLVIAGQEERMNQLPHHLMEKWKSDIVLLGYISEEEKGALFQKAALFIWPSFYEGFGIPLLEAMASGTPIVTSNSSAPKEITADAALCVDPKDPKEIADAMEQILSSQVQSQNLIEAGLKRAQDFSLELFRDKYLSLYQNIL